MTDRPTDPGAPTPQAPARDADPTCPGRVELALSRIYEACADSVEEMSDAEILAEAGDDAEASAEQVRRVLLSAIADRVPAEQDALLSICEPVRTCRTCSHFEPGHCGLFETMTTPDSGCNAWAGEEQA